MGRLVVDTVHHDLVSTHGGLPGPYDEGLLEVALARPRQLWSNSASVDVASLAAAYVCEIARNRPYNDGNQRISFVVAAVFAELNAHRLSAPESEVVDVMLSLADGTIEEDKLAEWLRAGSPALGDSHSRQRGALQLPTERTQVMRLT